MKEVVEFIKKNSKTDRGKAVWFFVAFALLLLVLMVLARTGTRYPLEDQLNDLKNANNKKSGVNISDLSQLKYTYNYVINHDNNIIKINGKISERSEEFNCLKNNKTYKYYRNEDGLYRLSNLKWIESNECSSFYKFYNLAYINKILDEATLDHTTNYKDGKVEFYLLISVNNITNIVDEKITDFSDNPVSIKVSYDEENVIKAIDFDLSS